MRLIQISTLALVLAAPAIASAQIRSPGQHPRYSAELEPHLLLAWDSPGTCVDTGLGAGFRAAIPFLDNGPVPTINNNMGIGFGIDYAHYSANYCGFIAPGFVAPNWSVNVFDFPVVAQWNFFFTPKISVFGEPGFYIRHWSVSSDIPCAGGPGGAVLYCHVSNSDTDFNPAIAGGARFLFTDSLSAMVRVGWPYISAGLGIWL